MNTNNSLLSWLLNCGYLDLDFLINLVEEYDLDFDVEDTLDNYWYTQISDLNINIFIYDAFEKIKDKFFEEKAEEIEWIYTKKYTIFTNYMDSHLWFECQELQDLFEEWKKEL